MPPPASAFSASSLTTEAAYLVGERLMRIWSEPGGLANRLLNRELLIPAVAASVSCGVLLLSLAASCVSGLRNPNGVDSGADSEQARDTSPSSLRERVLWHVKARRGTFNYQLLRLVLGLALLVLAACEENVTPNSFSLGQIHLPFFKWLHSNRHASLTSLSLSITYLYAVLLGFMTLFANKSWSSTTSRHSTFIYSSTFIVYAYRDMYPLATFTHIPKDNVEGLLLWFKILLLFLSGVAIPLVVPREYVPFDSKNRMEPNPEQTASLFSMLTYSFMSPIVYLAYRLPHLSYNQLPPLADYDYAHNLKSGSFKHLDLFSGAPHRHIFWGLMQVFRFEYTAMSILIALMVFASFVSPIGINFLLRYLEGEASPADLKPWVWILLLFLGPLSASLCWQGYIFFATRALVRCEAIITQLVFEHSLRIRVKAETEKGVQSPGSNVANDSSATATVVEAFDENAQSEVSDNGTEHSRDATAVSTQTTSAETVLASSSSVKSTSSKRSQQGQNIKPEGPPAGTSNASNLVGRINNLVTTDLGNITDARNLTFVVVYIPLQITLCMVFLYILLGWSAFVGLGVMIALYPLPGIVAKKIQQVQKMRLKRTDARVQTVTEAMNVLRMIKLFGWENKMQDRISEKREEELLCLWQLQILELINGNVTYDKVLLTSDECGLLSPSYAIPIIVMVATLFTYVRTSTGFSSLFDLMRDQLFMAFWMVNSVIAGKVSLDRVNEFLKEASKSTELLDAYTDKEQAAFLPQLDADDPRIGFNDATFTWSIDTDGALTPSKRKYLLKIDGELLFKRNALNLIVGPTGSGKTSMLMALLNEMHYIPAGPGSWFNLPRRGGVAYAAQESWVQNETIKENILFGSPCDEERYRKVLHQCGLERDLELFEAGDLTEVGEKGLTLSGGQKARVTLARAIYSPAEIILLDDVLAALDVHTAKWIVDKCLGGDLVRDRTVLLVTHNIAMVRSLAGFAVSIGTDGCIVAHGTVDSVLGADEAISRVLEENKESIEMASEVVDKPQTAVPPTDGKLIVAEEIEVGHVSWKSVKLFLLGLGGSHPGLFFLSFLGGLFISDLISTFQTWFLGYWASQYETHHPSDVSVPYYLTIYVSLLFAAVTFYMSGYTVFIFGVVRASRVLHQKLIQSVLGTTLRWLDTTPTSRILTRCTQDIRAVDGPLKDNGKWLTEITVTMMTKLGAVVFMTPIFLVPGMIVGAIGGWIGQIYMAAQLSVKREMSNAKAPVVGHFGAAIAGLTSIRAYSAEEAFIAGSLERINRYTRAARVFYNLNRWVCVRIDTIGGLFAAALGTYLVYIKPSSPSSVGFSLNMAVSFSSLILYWIRHFNDFEVQGNSLERIQGYINIEQEKKPSREGEPPAYWPASGSLVVSNLSAKYSPSSPKVLRDISFEIKSGERVGIVGRTGSGKSSLTLALLKCIFTEGSVIYDGVETSNLNLDALRSNVTIIPQIPELLSGSLRHNLDPFDQYDDVTLNDALRAAGLFALQADMEDGRITLDSSIASGGGNLSVGQRQILALARAIVRGSRLLILDEATSAIDHKTDTAIQMSLRHELGRDTTVITIAHRLQTIMDADKIMVLDAGEIVEFDSPSNLLDIEKGFLRSLVEESGDRQHLYDMAKGKHYDESR
ncbi:hypothetical protein NP233_g8310 [Leucocoprinus birnbaumii]|uniref:P-loop containing nucleoside triphosphate hydrolase protein n=1 Tax=Leucocoprinus birnbaumii TaxID=56174 RepID=A0AAD5VMM0_9AGAR|nr:hypothetical protein NP233_g8310 [Leucocoprinus birnbaumii]